MEAIHITRSSLQAINDLSGVRSLDTWMKRVASDAKDIAVFGEFSRGKSTLLNALAGAILLPAKLVPTTGHVTVLSYGTESHVSVSFQDGRVERCRIEDLDRFSLVEDSANRHHILSIEVVADIPFLRNGNRLIDTPGICDGRAGQADATERVLESASLVLFVLTARQLLSRPERQLIRKLVLERGINAGLVVNFMNTVDASDHEELVHMLDTFCLDLPPSPLGQPYFIVNALGALNYTSGRSTSKPQDDFIPLKAALESLDFEALQRSIHAGAITRTVRDIRRRNLQALAGLERSVENFRRERQNAMAQIHRREERLTERLEVISSDLGERVSPAVNLALANITSWMSVQLVETIAESGPELIADEMRKAAAKIEVLTNERLAEVAKVAQIRAPSVGLREELNRFQRIRGVSLMPRDYASAGFFGRFWKDVFQDYGQVAANRFSRKQWPEIWEQVFELLNGQIQARVQDMFDELQAELDTFAIPTEDDESAARRKVENHLVRLTQQLSNYFDVEVQRLISSWAEYNRIDLKLAAEHFWGGVSKEQP